MMRRRNLRRRIDARAGRDRCAGRMADRTDHAWMRVVGFVVDVVDAGNERARDQQGNEESADRAACAVGNWKARFSHWSEIGPDAETRQLPSVAQRSALSASSVAFIGFSLC